VSWGIRSLAVTGTSPYALHNLRIKAFIGISRECRDDPNLDCAVYLSVAGVYQTFSEQ
jgi:hypothetical protein